MSSRNFPGWRSHQVFPGGVWSCWRHTSRHSWGNSTAVGLLTLVQREWCPSLLRALSKRLCVCVCGLHVPPEKSEDNGECCVWDNSGVASWALVLFIAQFLVGPFGFSFHPHAGQHIYSGFAHLHACFCSLVKKNIKNRLKIFLYRSPYHAGVLLNWNSLALDGKVAFRRNEFLTKPCIDNFTQLHKKIIL